MASVSKSSYELPPLAILDCADPRCYTLLMVANAILDGFDLDLDRREKFKDYPNTLAFLDWAKSQRGHLANIRAIPGPRATVETFAAALLDAYSKLKLGELELEAPTEDL